jgi:hypothetical protein
LAQCVGEPPRVKVRQVKTEGPGDQKRPGPDDYDPGGPRDALVGRWGMLLPAAKVRTQDAIGRVTDPCG